MYNMKSYYDISYNFIIPDNNIIISDFKYYNLYLLLECFKCINKPTIRL